ncbi:UNVERIFIED_CONTAM: hypothetical protein K2H54_074828 [Gekko kuhli]
MKQALLEVMRMNKICRMVLVTCLGSFALVIFYFQRAGGGCRNSRPSIQIRGGKERLRAASSQPAKRSLERRTGALIALQGMALRRSAGGLSFKGCAGFRRLQFLG